MLGQQRNDWWHDPLSTSNACCCCCWWHPRSKRWEAGSISYTVNTCLDTRRLTADADCIACTVRVRPYRENVWTAFAGDLLLYLTLLNGLFRERYLGPINTQIYQSTFIAGFTIFLPYEITVGEESKPYNVLTMRGSQRLDTPCQQFAIITHFCISHTNKQHFRHS